METVGSCNVELGPLGIGSENCTEQGQEEMESAAGQEVLVVSPARISYLFSLKDLCHCYQMGAALPTYADLQ